MSALVGNPHQYELQILEQHLDTFGHVNNATYLVLLEQARWDWITSGGYGLREVQSLKQGPTILECSLRFLRELRLRERLTVKSWIESYAGKIAIVHQHMVSERGHTACEAVFKMALFDLEQRRLVAPSERWLATFGLTPEQVS
jgi:YbgC/YbaW family acyl-CoA thioester hydrolase